MAAGFFSQNGNGEMTGVNWIEESGTFSGPVAITNTHAVGVAHAAIIAWTVKHHPQLADAWPLPVAAETWDGDLNDINGEHDTEQAGVDALAASLAWSGRGTSVGGGTGMNRYEFRAGSGTASGWSTPHARHTQSVSFRAGEFRQPRGTHHRGLASRSAARRRQPDWRRPSRCPRRGSVIAVVQPMPRPSP